MKDMSLANRGYNVAVLLIPLFALLAAYWPTENFFSNQYDDSYITYRYAINLAEGNGLVFNIGEKTDAASSFLYTLVLSALWIVGVRNLELAGGLIGVLSFGVLNYYTYKLAYYLSSDKRAASIVTIASGLNGFLMGWALSGMETLMWAAAVMVAIYLMARGAGSIFVVSAITVAAFTRLEGIFLAGAYLLVIFRSGAGDRRQYALLAAFVVAFIGFYAVKYGYYGVWISHAFEMKKVADYYQPAPWGVFKYWLLFGSLPLLLSLYGLLSNRHLPFFCWVAISFLAVMLGPASDWARYSVHILPVLYGFSSIGISRFRHASSTCLWRQVGIVGVFVLMIAQSVLGGAFNWKNMTALAKHQICRKEIGKYINLNIPAGEYVASSDLGAISYMALNYRFVDLIALTSADILAAYKQGKTADDILESRNVRYFADTFLSPYHNRLDSLLAQFPMVRGRSSFDIAATPDFTCTVGDTLRFDLVKILRVQN